MTLDEGRADRDLSFQEGEAMAVDPNTVGAAAFGKEAAKETMRLASEHFVDLVNFFRRDSKSSLADLRPV
jgi:hypothetical protein